MSKLIHAKDETELGVLKAVLPNLINEDDTIVYGLTAASQMSLLKAQVAGTEIVSTGLPLDIASAIGAVTIVRAWDKAIPGGGRSMGSQPAKKFLTIEVLDDSHLAELQASDAFLSVTGKAPAEEDGSEPTAF